jgi:hypothetical protein
MIAFVLGNGKSREGINLYSLKKYGAIYGCNALYREFDPDVLVSTDLGISNEIQHSGWPKTHRHYTRKPFSDSGSLELDPNYKGMSSGPNAVQLAIADGFKEIYLLGFDLGSTHSHFNNVYADTKHYKKSLDSATFGGNWATQLLRLADENPEVSFFRIVTDESKDFEVISNAANIKTISKSQFLKSHK